MRHPSFSAPIRLSSGTGRPRNSGVVVKPPTVVSGSSRSRRARRTEMIEMPLCLGASGRCGRPARCSRHVAHSCRSCSVDDVLVPSRSPVRRLARSVQLGLGVADGEVSSPRGSSASRRTSAPVPKRMRVGHRVDGHEGERRASPACLVEEDELVGGRRPWPPNSVGQPMPSQPSLPMRERCRATPRPTPGLRGGLHLRVSSSA